MFTPPIGSNLCLHRQEILYQPVSVNINEDGIIYVVKITIYVRVILKERDILKKWTF